MRKLTTRLTAMLLSGILVIGSAPGSVFAADADAGQISEYAKEVFTEEEAAEESSETADTAAEVAEENVADTSEETAAQYYTVTLEANGGYFENEWDDSIGDYVQQAEVVVKQIPVDGTVAAFPVYLNPNGQSMVFSGWSLDRDGELVSQAEEEFIPVDDCTLYAVWQAEDVALGETGDQELVDEGTEQADSVQDSEEAYTAEESADAVTSEENRVEEDVVTEFTEDTSDAPVGAGETTESEDTSTAPASTGDITEEASGKEAEEVQYYTVTLDANGGYFENEWDDSIGEIVEQVEVVEKHVPLDGAVSAFPVFTDLDGQSMVFAGWSLERNGEMVTTGDEKYAPVENCALYAVWHAVESDDASWESTDNQEYTDESTEQEDLGQEATEEAESVEGTEAGNDVTEMIEEIGTSEESDTVEGAKESDDVESEKVTQEHGVTEDTDTAKEFEDSETAEKAETVQETTEDTENAEEESKNTKVEEDSRDTEAAKETKTTQEENDVEETVSDMNTGLDSDDDSNEFFEDRAYNNSVSFAGGNGTQIDPYQIKTAEQLDAVRNDLSAYYILVDNIDIGSYNWKSIGNVNEGFEGEFDGNGYSINNLTIQKQDGVSIYGLFNITKGTVKNVTLQNCDVNIQSLGSVDIYNPCVGTLCGREYEYGKIYNCKTYGTINVSVDNSAFVGGVVGYGENDISGCENHVDIIVTTPIDTGQSGAIQCGGIVGDNGNISHCSNYGKINASGNSFCYCGGISGKDGLISECINYGSISGSIMAYHGWSSFAGNCNVGGIVGATSFDVLDKCINYGSISASKTCENGSCYSGGVAGFVGYYSSGSITNCINAGPQIYAKDGSAGRVAGCVMRPDNLYSLSSTLCNGEIPSSEKDVTEKNGQDIEGSELDGLINRIIYGMDIASSKNAFTLEQTWGFDMDNLGLINYGHYLRFFGPAHAALLLAADNGSDGICSGMVTSSIAVSGYNSPPCTSFVLQDGSNASILDDVKAPELRSNDINYSAADLVKYAHVYQNTKKVQEERKNNSNDLESLYNAIKESIKNHDQYVEIRMRGELAGNTKSVGHVLLAMGIASDDNKTVDIIVYDGNFSYSSCHFYLYKTNGIVTEWEYPSFDWGTGKQYAEISFTTSGDDFSRDFYPGSMKEEAKRLLSIKNNRVDFQLKGSNKASLSDESSEDFLRIVSSNEKYIDENDVDINQSYNYWILSDDDITIENDCADNQVSLASQDKEIDIKSLGNSEINMRIDDSGQCFVSYDGLQQDEQYSIEIKSYEENISEDMKYNLVSVDGSAYGQEEVSISQNDDDVLIITGTNSLEYTAVNEEGIIVEKKDILSDGKDIRITSYENETKIELDTDDDGVFDKDVSDGVTIDSTIISEDANGNISIELDKPSYSIQEGDALTIDATIKTDKDRVEGQSEYIGYFAYYANRQWNQLASWDIEGGTTKYTLKVKKDTWEKYDDLIFTVSVFPKNSFTQGSALVDKVFLVTVSKKPQETEIDKSIADSGSCGKSLTWSLNKDGVLVISGNGVIPDWPDSSNIPWRSHTSNITEIVLKSGVTGIGTASFKGCGKVTKIKIPESVLEIGDYAFSECGLLKTIVIPSKATSIGDAAFSFCAKIEYVSIPGSVSKIGKCAFEGCSNLRTVEIGTGVKTIDKWAFYTCSSLVNVSIPKSITSIGDDSFENCSANLVISGKAGSYAEKYSKEKGIAFVDPSNLGYATVTGLAAKTYTGKAITQSPTVKIGSIILTRNTDYTISYKSNTNVGTATVTITGKGNYTSKKIATFKINKAAQSITAKAAAPSVAVGKTTTVSILGAKGSKSYKSSNTTIATVTSAGKVTAKKVGTVKITATSAATANYKAASKTVTIKVVPAATTSLTAANQATGIKLTWNKVTGANGYKVYRGSTLIKTITSGSTVTYADTKANTNGTKYTYKVVAKGTTGDSTLSKSVAVYRVARPAISSATNSAASKMTVKWGKNAKANGYQIQYSTSKTFASGNKAVTVTSASTVSKVIGSLTKGKTYYVRIRTYKTVGSAKYWSEWSAAKSVKISK